MKRILILMLSLILVLGYSLGAVAAIHNSYGDIPNYGSLVSTIFIVPYLGNTKPTADTWFTIDDPEPYFRGSFNSVSEGELTLINLEYFLNDQTYGDISNMAVEDGDLTEIKGSYLFDFGLFVGLDYLTADEADFYVLSPGYRFALNEESYIALSVDYLNVDEVDYNEVSGYDIDFKYKNDSLRFMGQIYKFKEYDELIYDLMLNVKASDTLTYGFYLGKIDESIGYNFGFTWKQDLVTVDFEYGSVSDELDDSEYYALSGMFNFTDQIAAGIEYRKIEALEDAGISYKFRYTNDNSSFVLVYTPETDSIFDTTYLTYSVNL